MNVENVLALANRIIEEQKRLNNQFQDLLHERQTWQNLSRVGAPDRGLLSEYQLPRQDLIPFNQTSPQDLLAANQLTRERNVGDVSVVELESHWSTGDTLQPRGRRSLHVLSGEIQPLSSGNT